MPEDLNKRSEQQEQEKDHEFIAAYMALCEKYRRRFIPQLIITDQSIDSRLVVMRDE